MDFHLDTLLNLPNVTVFTASPHEGFTLLRLELLNEGINCPHCQSYTDIIHQTRPIYLQVPRRQFYCSSCKKSPTEPLPFVEKRRKYTRRYEEYIYEKVKELTVEQVD
jgi:transposase